MTDTAETIERRKIVDCIGRLRHPGAAMAMPEKWRSIIVKALTPSPSATGERWRHALRLAKDRIKLLMKADLPESDHPTATRYVLEQIEAALAAAPPPPAVQGEGARETVANWMLLRGYATGHGDTVQDLLFEMEAQAKGRGGPPEPPPGEGDFKLLQADVERLRARAEKAETEAVEAGRREVAAWAERDSYMRSNEKLTALVAAAPPAVMPGRKSLDHDGASRDSLSLNPLRDALQVLATGEPVAAGGAQPMPYKEWVRQVAGEALKSSTDVRMPQEDGRATIDDLKTVLRRIAPLLRAEAVDRIANDTLERIAGPAPQSDGWREIASAPKDGRTVLLFDPGWLPSHPWRAFAPARWVFGAHRFESGDFTHPGATHWQPLPSPPHAAEKA